MTQHRPKILSNRSWGGAPEPNLVKVRPVLNHFSVDPPAGWKTRQLHCQIHRRERNNRRARPFACVGFGTMDVTKPNKCVWSGDIHGPKPCECKGTRAMIISRAHRYFPLESLTQPSDPWCDELWLLTQIMICLRRRTPQGSHLGPGGLPRPRGGPPNLAQTRRSHPIEGRLCRPAILPKPKIFIGFDGGCPVDTVARR